MTTPTDQGPPDPPEGWIGPEYDDWNPGPQAFAANPPGVCDRCGAIVANRDAHNLWHQNVAWLAAMLGLAAGVDEVLATDVPETQETPTP